MSDAAKEVVRHRGQTKINYCYSEAHAASRFAFECSERKKSSQQGTIVLFFETDLQKTAKTTESDYTPLQKHCFNNLSSTEQQKIRQGYGTVITDIESGENICEFNMENHALPQYAIESFARLLLPMVQEYYSDPANRRKFEESRENKK